MMIDIPTRCLHSPWPILGLFILLALTGCVDRPGDTPVQHDDSPQWQTGDWWEYQIEGHLPAKWMDIEATFPGAEELGHAPRFTVDTESRFTAVPNLSRDGLIEGEPARILTENQEVEFLTRFGLPLAAEWAMWQGTSWSHHSFLDWNSMENQSAVPHLQGARFFEWPLEDNKAWETEFMHRNLELEATRVNDSYLIDATYGGQVVLRYEYDPEVQWFRSFQVFDDGERILSVELLDHGTDFNGMVYAHASASQRATCYGGAGPLPASPGICERIGVRVYEGGETSLRIHFTYLSTGPGAMSVVRNMFQEDQELWHFDTCPCDESIDYIEGPLDPGDYTWDINDAMSDNRWMYFAAFSRCFEEYQIEGDHVQRTTTCTRG